VKTERADGFAFTFAFYLFTFVLNLPARFAFAATAATATVAATTAAATSVAAAPATTTAAAAVCSRLRFVDGQSTAAEVFAVELFDGRRRAFRRRHFDEAEAARAARVTIFDHGRRLDFASL
jgi:hypothetical protein